ncbi:MAG: thioredoxin family protein [Rikenellaceae bacterium]|nr:thioredoxin family protein [Rikenellaceae bacterium]MCL2693296.1 thioredoxin family protein [Rikenellaceae bacterium]
MKKILFALLLIFVNLSLTAQPRTSGIRFFEGTWDEALALARSEGKTVFIDFYTEWCGPCLTMALGVFTLPEVGEVYNARFINLKIDAEKGEGVELARRYEVRSFPTFLFVDPATQQVIHRSGSNKSAERFLHDAFCASTPGRGSVAMEARKAAGGYDAQFLKEYILMKDAARSREVPELFAEFLDAGADLRQPDVWAIYVTAITGLDNPYLQQVSDGYDDFAAIFGREAVDAKLADATANAPEQVIASLCDFAGKEHNIFWQRVSRLLRDGRFGEALQMVYDSYDNPAVDQHDIADRMYYQVRIFPSRDNELPFETVVDKVRCLRHVAYNVYDREKVYPHFEYAVGLEYLIGRAVREGRQIPPELLAAPQRGQRDYNLRHPALKLKPR